MHVVTGFRMADDEGRVSSGGSSKRQYDFPASAIGTTMRLIRRARRLRATDIAQEMQMPLRSYEYLESGKGRSASSGSCASHGRLTATVGHCSPALH